MKSPYRKWLELTVNDRLEKLGLPKMSAMIGVSRSRTRAVTTAPNAAPTTTATARSTTFPRSRNALKSFTIDASKRSGDTDRFGAGRRTPRSMRRLEHELQREVRADQPDHQDSGDDQRLRPDDVAERAHHHAEHKHGEKRPVGDRGGGEDQVG